MQARVLLAAQDWNPENLRTRMLDLLSGRFDTMAGAWIAIVASYQEVGVYEQLLVRFTDSTLTVFDQQRLPPWVNRSELRADLVLRVRQRSAHWWAEALAIAREGAEASPGDEPALRPATWEGISIQFISDHRVQITVAQKSYPQTYAEMGFADARNDLPNRAWTFLLTLAQHGGLLSKPPDSRDSKWPLVEKRVQEIRKTLRAHFSREGYDIPSGSDPIPFIHGVGYRAVIVLSVSPSFDA
jgi:hypothetical protein